MKPNTPVSRSAPSQRYTAGVSSQPGALQDNRERTVGQAVSRESGGVAFRVERHGQWALLSRAQGQLSGLQQSEQAVVSSYRELLSLKRKLDRSAIQGNSLADQVASLRQRLERDGALDNNLRRQESPARVNYRLERVDLLSPRDQRENLQINLPTGKTLHLRLEAGASEQQNLQQLRSVFRQQGMEASVADSGALALRGSKAQLGSPWVFQGQGVRVPAGNPVPIQLSREQDELDKLEDGLRRGELQAERQRIKELLATLEQERRNLEAQRQQLMAEIRNSQGPTPEAVAAMGDGSEALRQVLTEGDFTLQLNTLLAQANVSRFSVVALLGR